MNAKALLRDTLIPELKQLSPYFTIDHVRSLLEAKQIEIADSTLKRYMSDFMEQGVIHDAGRGWYSSIAKPFVLNTEPVQELIARIEKQFPLLGFSCWSTQQINPYMHHLLAKFVTFVFVERDLMPAVFDVIRDWKDFEAYLDPSGKEARKNFAVAPNTIVLRPETGEAPGQGEGHAAPVEKLLVDLAIEVGKLSLMGRGEFHDAAWRAVTNGRISMGALALYARRNHRSIDDLFGEKRLTNGTT
jgi:hypothetical protein